MQQNKKRVGLGNGFYSSREKEMKTSPEAVTNYSNSEKTDEKSRAFYDSPVATTCIHYFTLVLLGLLSWGVAWCAMGDNWRWDGPWFRIAAVGVVAWASGLLLQATTSLPPLLAALLTGIIARHFNILDMRHFTHVDGFLRKIYPVLILGKGSLAWNASFMKQNWKQIATLGALPWNAEVLAVTVCTYMLLGFPWTWGVLLGSIYASVSCPVIIPSVLKIGARADRNWPQLVCTSGGTDTMLSVGTYGLMFTYMFSECDDTYKYIKAALTFFVGAFLGFAWGWVCGNLPHPRNFYVLEMRVLMVLFGGLFASFFSSHIEWGGTAGVAVLICNATAANYWKKDGWKLNNNPASTAYRVMWSSVEPFLFAYTGTFFVINSETGTVLLYGFAILMICLTIRLSMVVITCWHMKLKEKIFICCVWTPKSIVEAVLCPVAINTLMATTASKAEMGYAEDILKLIVEAILITTPIGFLLTHYLGPWLLKEKTDDEENESAKYRRKSTSYEDVKL